MDEERPEDAPGEWVSVREAARRLRVDPKTVRDRIRAGTLRAKVSGNRGRLVWVTEPPREPPGEDEEPPGNLLDELREALAEERVGRARAEGRAEVLAGGLVKAEARVERLEAELAEMRRPWLARVLAAWRRR
jgi:hypothetical protein